MLLLNFNQLQDLNERCLTVTSLDGLTFPRYERIKIPKKCCHTRRNKDVCKTFQTFTGQPSNFDGLTVQISTL